MYVWLTSELQAIDMREWQNKRRGSGQHTWILLFETTAGRCREQIMRREKQTEALLLLGLNSVIISWGDGATDWSDHIVRPGFICTISFRTTAQPL